MAPIDEGSVQGGAWAGRRAGPHRVARAPSLHSVIAFVVCAIVTALVVVLGYLAIHNAAAARDAERRLGDLQRSTAAAESARAGMYRAVPHSRTVSDYGAPYNVRVVCTVAGSVGGPNGTRRPLDLKGTPRPGDVYVKTCRGYRRPARAAATAATTGQPVG
jgi:hypothetical protein